MVFNSLTFIAFFAIVLLLDRLIANHTARKAMLLVASIIFYAAWNPPYTLLLVWTILLDWSLARALGRSSSPTARRALLALSVGANLLVLVTFKYAAFLQESLATILGGFGVAYTPAPVSWLLPIGISFYTFASLSYTIDVYRREIRGDASLLDYALFVSFFPHLVAGPIVRAKQLLPQLAAPVRATPRMLGWGIVLLVVGLGMKCVFADAILAPVADAVFGSPGGFGTIDTTLGVLAFSGQIYFDFAGYSTCAIGLALALGYAFPDNFRAPYAAFGFSDFWRRWHITLSQWLRDYLYIPLGGNRGTRLRTAAALMTTMLLGGLWHGASWLFVLWGALHGLFLVLERAAKDIAPTGRIPGVVKALATFVLVTLAWIPFRATTWPSMMEVFAGFVRAAPRVLPTTQAVLVGGVIAGMLAWQYATRERPLETTLGRLPAPALGALLGVILIAMYMTSGGDGRAFIYFQF